MKYPEPGGPLRCGNHSEVPARRQRSRHKDLSIAPKCQPCQTDDGPDFLFWLGFPVASIPALPKPFAILQLSRRDSNPLREFRIGNVEYNEPDHYCRSKRARAPMPRLPLTPLALCRFALAAGKHWMPGSLRQFQKHSDERGDLRGLSSLPVR